VKRFSRVTCASEGVLLVGAERSRGVERPCWSGAKFPPNASPARCHRRSKTCPRSANLPLSSGFKSEVPTAKPHLKIESASEARRCSKPLTKDKGFPMVESVGETSSCALPRNLPTKWRILK